jgi:hypothetical protein
MKRARIWTGFKRRAVVNTVMNRITCIDVRLRSNKEAAKMSILALIFPKINYIIMK